MGIGSTSKLGGVIDGCGHKWTFHVGTSLIQLHYNCLHIQFDQILSQRIKICLAGEVYQESPLLCWSNCSLFLPHTTLATYIHIVAHAFGSLYGNHKVWYSERAWQDGLPCSYAYVLNIFGLIWQTLLILLALYMVSYGIWQDFFWGGILVSFPDVSITYSLKNVMITIPLTAPTLHTSWWLYFDKIKNSGIRNT